MTSLPGLGPGNDVITELGAEVRAEVRGVPEDVWRALECDRR